MNGSFISNRDRKGFTLVEILVVMLLTSILILGVNTAFRQVHMMWSRTEKERNVYQQTRLVFDTLQDELSCLYLPKTDDDKKKPALFILSKSSGSVSLSFFTMNPVWGTTSISNLPSKVSYKFSNSNITRTEQLVSGEKSITASQKETILKGFSEVSIQASDPDVDSLADSWKSNLKCKKSPPKAVKILLKWSHDEKKDFKFETIIKIFATCQLTDKQE